MDDFSGDYLIGPIHPSKFTNAQTGEVIIKKYSQIGTHCVIFPNVIIDEGCIVGAMTLVNKSLNKWSIYIGQPAKYLKERKSKLLDLFETTV